MVLALELQVDAQQRPKIGLALSGGGVRGFAHIGVLDWFEKNRIPVDYIAGTSIGGLVGGFYATGMSPSEIRQLILTLDWEKLLSGPPSFDELTFRRKEDRRTYPATLEFGLRGGLRLPRALNPGHYIGLAIDRTVITYGGIRAFDELPIPFHCVATDLQEGESVVLKDGSLGQALRATMAVPGIFTPVEIGGRVLGDGGLLNNIPSDVVQQMGAELIIAVNVATPLLGREELETLPGVLEQVVGLAAIEGERRGIVLADIVLKPELGEYKQFDYQAREELINLGFRGAESMAARLQALSLDDVAWRQHLEARNIRKRTQVPVPSAIEVTGIDQPQALEIFTRLEDHVEHPVDSHKLERQLSDIRGGGRYESLGYEIVDSNGIPKLLIRVREKRYGPPFIIPVIQLQSRTNSDVAFSAGFRLTHFDVGARDSELRLDAVVGSNTILGLEYFWPLGRYGPFVAPRVFLTSDRTNLYQSGQRIGQYLVSHAGAAMDVGYIFGKNAQIRVGYQAGLLDADVDVGEGLPNVHGGVNAGSARFVYNTLDSAIAPRHGIRFNSEYSWYLRSPGAREGFPLAEADMSAYMPVFRNGVLFGTLAGGTTFSKTPGPVEQFTIGGPFRLSAYGLDEFRGSQYVLGNAGYRHRMGTLPTLIGGNVHGSLWYEQGSAFFRRRDADYRHDIAGAVQLDTLLGPLVLGGAWGDGGSGKVFFSFGRVF